MSQTTQNTQIPTNAKAPVFFDTFEYGGVIVPFDSTEYETAKRFEEGILRMQEDFKAVKKDGALCEVIKSTCKVYERFVDSLFGEGTFMKMCGGKYSNHITNELYDRLIETMTRQRIANESIKVGMAAKYLPNRAARRAADKK